MRVIPECSRVRRRKLVHELLAWSDWRLGKAWHAIHGVRQSDAMPVHRRIFRQLVAHDDAHVAYPEVCAGRDRGHDC
jgi:hypothetical protein